MRHPAVASGGEQTHEHKRKRTERKNVLPERADALGAWGENPSRRDASLCSDDFDGARVALVSYGAETEEIIAAKDLLAQHGVQADCVKLTQLYPLPDGVRDTLKHYDTILFAEDTVRTGGIGEQLGFAMQQCGWQGEFLLHAVDNSHLLHANVPELRKDQQLDAAALCTDILNALKEKRA